MRRSIAKEGLTTPKSGRARRIPLTSALAEQLFDLLAARQKGTNGPRGVEMPAWEFCSKVGTPLEPRNVERSWYRLLDHCSNGERRVGRLKLHATRHTWATLALQAGKSVRWVAEVLGHADPSLTLRVYAHALREEESDLSFADFGGFRRPQAAPETADTLDTDELEGEIPNDDERFAWRAGRGSNPRPPGSKPGALSS